MSGYESSEGERRGRKAPFLFEGETWIYQESIRVPSLYDIFRAMLAAVETMPHFMMMGTLSALAVKHLQAERTAHRLSHQQNLIQI